MIRTISCVGALALAVLNFAACSDDAYVEVPPLTGGSGAGTGGTAAGTGGTAAGAGGTAAGTGGSSAGTGGSAAGSGGSSAGAAGSAGTGGTGEASDAGAADASVAPDAGACTDPSCECAVEAITALPYSEQWQTTEDTETDVIDLECQLCDNTADHIVTFTAPSSATYRFFATSGGDVELAVYPGDCTASPSDVACGEDIDANNDDFSDQVNVELAQGETVTVVVGESCEENGGTGTLAIEIVP